MKRLRRARSVNQANKLAIHFESSFTPNEIMAVFDRAFLTRLPRFPRESIRFLFRSLGWFLRRLHPTRSKNSVEGWVASYKWLLLFRNQFDRLYSADNVYFERHELATNVTLFRSSSNNDRLLLAFPPKSGRFGPSNPIFLLIAEEIGFDVLRIRPEREQQGPWASVIGVRGGFEGFVGLIESAIKTHAYREVHTMGLSFGAPMSLMAGMAIGADTINPIGLLNEPSQLEKAYGKCWSSAVNSIKDINLGGGGRINLVAGEEDARDVQVAEVMSQELPGSSIILVERAPHGAVMPLFRRKQLSGFLSSLISNFRAEKNGALNGVGFRLHTSQNDSH